MKKLEIKFINITFLILLLVLTSANLASGQDYAFPSEFEIGATYDWKVKDLKTSGPVSTPYLNFGGEPLSKGDVISVKLIQNINILTNGSYLELLEPNNIWAEFYLNGEFMTNVTEDIEIFVLDWIDFSRIQNDNYFFIQPITYEDETGIYNYFEVLNSVFPQLDEQSTIEYETEDVYTHTKTNLKQSSKLTSKSWTLIKELTVEETDNNLQDPWEKTKTNTKENIEVRFNVNTGLLSYIEYSFEEHFEREVDGSVDIDDEEILVHIESTSVPIGVPFNWVFSLFGLFVIGSVIYIRRKK